jgi:Fe-S oxidoreductase
VKVERIYKVFDEYRGLSDSKLRPTELKSEQFLKAFRELLDKKNNWPFLLPLRLALEACTHCGTCAEACPLYIGSGRNKLYSPVYRTDMLRKIYKRYFTLTGKIFRSLIGAKEITEQDANAMAEAAYRCTICRRCVLACPFGLDNGLVMREIRKIFAELRIIPEELKEEGVDNQLRYGSAPKISYEALMNILDFVKGEIEENRKNVNIKIPVDKVGAKYLIINNAGDYLSFLDTIRGIIEVMNYVNVDWTFNSPRTGGIRSFIRCPSTS